MKKAQAVDEQNLRGNSPVQPSNPETSQRLKLSLCVMAAVWTITLGISLFYALRHIDNGTLDTARSHAQSAFEKDVLYRRWVAGLGGIYALRTDSTPPTPI